MPPEPLDYQPPPAKPDRTPLQVANLVVVVAALLVYFAMFGSVGGVGAIAFFFLFTMSPFVINAVLTLRWRSSVAQSLILVASLVYTPWFAFVFVDVNYLHPDPQGPIAFLFVGVFAAPVLLILWVVAGILDGRRRAA